MLLVVVGLSPAFFVEHFQFFNPFNVQKRNIYNLQIQMTSNSPLFVDFLHIVISVMNLPMSKKYIMYYGPSTH